MATPEWPSGVPLRFSPSTYSEVDEGNVLVSRVDSPRPKTRRRFATTVTTRRFTIQLDDTERDALRSWIDASIAGGALEFLWYNPMGTGERETVRLVMPRGGIRWRQLRRDAAGRNRWSAVLTVEVRP